MLIYQFDPNILHMEESPNKEEIEIRINLLQPEPFAANLKRVKDFFDDNEYYTEVLFYFYKNNEYKIIVRNDYYVDLILMLMRHQLLQKVEWQS
jgi:hypothetical protein